MYIKSLWMLDSGVRLSCVGFGWLEWGCTGADVAFKWHFLGKQVAECDRS